VLRDETITLEIYELSRSLHVLVFLFPLGPSILFYGSFYAPLALSSFVASLCYLPVLIIARHQAGKLQTAGTDRVATAENAISEAFGVALVGIIFVVGATAITWGAKAVAPGA
jgi:hypothetical protein